MAEVAGIYMERSLHAFVQACEVYIDEEQDKFAPDNVLIALLCDAIRLTRELMQCTETVNQLTHRLLQSKGVE